MQRGDSAVLQLVAPKPRSEWRVRLTASAYRLPEEDGGPDKRPLAWLLNHIEAGELAPSAQLLTRWRARLSRYLRG